MKAGLIVRQGSDQGYTYRSRVCEILAQDCPLIARTEVVEQIEQAAR